MADDEPQLEPSLDADAPAGEDGEEGEGTKGGGKKKLIIIVLAVVLLLGGGGAAAYFTGMLDGLLGKGGAEHAEGAEGGHGGGGEHGEGAVSGPSFLKIPDMVVNLSSDSAQPRYLRLSVQLELKSPADVAKVEAVMPRVTDQFQTYLRELRVSDLRGSAGIYRLQMELLSRVNAAAYPVVVQDVLFQEILIQ